MYLLGNTTALKENAHQFYAPEKHFCVFDRLSYLIIKVLMCLDKMQLSRRDLVCRVSVPGSCAVNHSFQYYLFYLGSIEINILKIKPILIKDSDLVASLKVSLAEAADFDPGLS